MPARWRARWRSCSWQQAMPKVAAAAAADVGVVHGDVAAPYSTWLVGSCSARPAMTVPAATAAAAAAGALAVAREVRQQAPLDGDAAGLLALLLVAQPAQHSQAQSQSQSQQSAMELEQQQSAAAAAALSPEAAAEAADCCCQMLAGDPSCHAAVVALLGLQDRHPLPPAVLAAGCCYYLEAQPPSWLPPLLELRGATGCGPGGWLADRCHCACHRCCCCRGCLLLPSRLSIAASAHLRECSVAAPGGRACPGSGGGGGAAAAAA